MRRLILTLAVSSRTKPLSMGIFVPCWLSGPSMGKQTGRVQLRSLLTRFLIVGIHPSRMDLGQLA